MSDWKDRARRLIASGMSIAAAARSVGKGATTVRVGLDINGERARMVERNRANKAKYRAAEKAEKAIRPRVEAPPKRADRSVQAAYADKPAVRPLTLPRISLPILLEEPRAWRFAPRVRSTASEGAERWRQIHLAMKRAGKIEERLEVRHAR